MEIKEYIVEEADKLFCKFGIKSVTMDDIAKHLGMSKKTIYQHFKDKNEIVDSVISTKIWCQNCVMEKTESDAENAVQEIYFIVTNIHEMFSNMNPVLFYDLQKYHPSAWRSFNDFKENTLFKKVIDNIYRGINEDLYRKDLNAEILTIMRLNQLDLAFGGVNTPNNNFSITEMMTEMTEHFLYGLCNLKGHKLLNQYKLITE